MRDRSFPAQKQCKCGGWIRGYPSGVTFSPPYGSESISYKCPQCGAHHGYSGGWPNPDPDDFPNAKPKGGIYAVDAVDAVSKSGA